MDLQKKKKQFLLILLGDHYFINLRPVYVFNLTVFHNSSTICTSIHFIFQVTDWQQCLQRPRPPTPSLSMLCCQSVSCISKMSANPNLLFQSDSGANGSYHSLQWSLPCWALYRCVCGDNGVWRAPTPSSLTILCTRKPRRKRCTSAGTAPTAIFILR